MAKQAQTPAKRGRKGKQGGGEEECRAFVPYKKNTNAVKWTEDVVIEKLNEIMARLTEDEDTPGHWPENPVRANTIKFQKEVCLMVGISAKTYTEWKEKFCKTERRDYTTNEMGPNETFSEAVSELIQKISDICECRLQYSGTVMDIFVLKNHYGMADSIDHTQGGGKDLPPVTVSPQVTIHLTPDDDDTWVMDKKTL
jgi:hypothetical protein